MTEPISAALHIEGATIRYAGIVREETAKDLRRLGHTTFEFDVTRALWEEDGSRGALDRVEAALQEAFDGRTPSSLRVVIHPLEAFSFFLPVPAGLSEEGRRRHVTHQAALVTGARSPDALHISLQSVRTEEQGGDTMEWIHVLALPRSVAERMDAMLRSISAEDTARMVSFEAAAQVLGPAESASPTASESPYSLAVGLYPTHTEYTLTRDGVWHHAHAAQESRSIGNRVYYAVGFLNRTGVPPSEIGRLFVYGPDAGSVPDDPFQAAFDCRPTSLNPFDGLRRTPEHPPEEAPGVYVPCVGGALKAASSE